MQEIDIICLLSILSIAGAVFPSSLHALNLAYNQISSAPKGEILQTVSLLSFSSLQISLSVIIL